MTHFPPPMVLRFGSVVLLLNTAMSISSAQSGDISLGEAALRGPAVQSILERPRETAPQQLHALFTLLDLGETDVAQSVWKEFAGEALEDATRAALVNEFGTARFLKLARGESVDGLTGARKFAESCLQAAAKFRSDPRRLAELIGKLGDASAETRRAARSDLAATGEPAAVACLEALAQAADSNSSGEVAKAPNEQLRIELLLTLAEIRPAVEPMLLAAIVDGRGQFRRDTVELAGYLHLHSAVPWLAAIAAGAETQPTVIAAAHAALAKMGLSAPQAAQARELIRGEIARLQANTIAASNESNWWIWHASTSPQAEPGKLMSKAYSAAMIEKLAIHRLASLLISLGDSTEADRRTERIYHFETVTTGQSSARNLGDLPAQRLSETLSAAIRGNHLRAAIECAERLQQPADVTVLRSAGKSRSPLAAALTHPDRELRYAALATVMSLAPQTPFAGASGVPKGLWNFAAGAGTPQAIAASPVMTRASDWAGKLRSLGYDATPVATGRDALRLALRSPRLELLLVDSDIGKPLLSEVHYGLRNNSTTNRLPVAILSSLHNLPRARRLASADRWLLATPRPHSDDTMEDVVLQLAAIKDSSLPNGQRRTEQAAAALGWIADLLENGHPYDELLRDAEVVNTTLHNPALTKPSLRLLSVLGTAASQQQMLDYVSVNSLPIEMRRLAAEALAASFARFGKQLTSIEISQQYDRYNASEAADADTQKVLGRVLDLLEQQRGSNPVPAVIRQP